MSSRTEKKVHISRGGRFEAVRPSTPSLISVLGMLTVLAMLALGLSACRSSGNPEALREWRLTGRWVIDYGRSARSILESRGMTADPARLNVAEAQLRQRFYGEFQFSETGSYTILHRLQGKEKKDHGSYVIKQQEGRRFVVSARSEPADPKAAPSPEESFSIEFVEPNLIRLEKGDDRELPPLILQREEVKP